MFWQLICHVIGDYVLQSDWMAERKRTSKYVALVHAHAYSFPFLWLVAPGYRGLVQICTILLTHAAIDHYGLARYVCFAKNFLAPRSAWPKWKDTNFTGYGKDKELYITFWLFVITDNLMHVVINYCTLRYL